MPTIIDIDKEVKWKMQAIIGVVREGRKGSWWYCALANTKSDRIGSRLASQIFDTEI
jgi:hypothetical protein